MRHKNDKTLSISLFSKPLLMDAHACESYLSLMNSRAYSFIEFSRNVNNMMDVTNGIAFIHINDILTHKDDSFMSFMFGATTYDDIRQAFNAAFNDSEVNGIIFDINSAGGEVAGLFDLVDEIYNSRGKKPIIAVANEMAYSAAYAIASAADKVYLPRTAGIGSIGVVAIHVDQTKFDENEGLKYNMIYAGDRKVELSSHAPLSDDARNRLQAEVNEQYKLFAETVARNRGISVDSIYAMQSGIFRGKKAVDAGLADTVLSFSQAITKITTGNKNNKGGSYSMKAFAEKIKSMIEAEGNGVDINAALGELGYMPKIGEGQVVLTHDALSAWSDAVLIHGKAEGRAEAEKEFRERMSELFDLCAVAGRADMLPTMLLNNMTIEDAKKAIIAEQARSTNAIRSTVGAVSTGDSNPLIEDAKERAKAKK